MFKLSNENIQIVKSKEDSDPPPATPYHLQHFLVFLFPLSDARSAAFAPPGFRKGEFNSCVHRVPLPFGSQYVLAGTRKSEESKIGLCIFLAASWQVDNDCVPLLQLQLMAASIL